ncbi:hypothetical protein DFP72DRAFT_1058307 [Ephemerocybe angulata]|uniref:Uncharacterized protein n=1 Tax=Ephemerocybe angulata TaxID=980116 RepID=A0A8H6IJQ9_9AGAR|nr:hypothetical protein DFP72DRAFT_1058307 [Tulosesus angulatus]
MGNKPQKNSAAKRNKFTMLASDIDTPDSSQDQTAEQASQQAMAGSQAQPALREEEEHASPPPETTPAPAPATASTPKVQTTMMAFIKSHPHTAQPTHAPRSPTARPSGSTTTPAAQPNLRLQFIQSALRVNEIKTEDMDEEHARAKGKGKRRPNDEEDKDEGDRTRPAPSSPEHRVEDWDTRSADSCEEGESEDDKDMYTDCWDSTFDIKQQKGRVNPFECLQPSQTLSPRRDAVGEERWVRPPPTGFTLPHITPVELAKRT